MSGFEGEEIYHTDQNFREVPEMEQHFTTIPRDDAFNKCKKFIREFVSEDVYVYRQQLMNNVANQLHYLKVEINDIQNFDHNLYNYMIQRPTDIQSVFEEAIAKCFCEFQGLKEDDTDFQLQLISQQNPRMLRELKSNLLGQLVTVSGIIISLTKNAIKAKKLCVVCKYCQDKLVLELGNGLSGQSIPRLCQGKKKNQGAQTQEQCPMDAYVIIPEESQMIDQQVLRIQEMPEQIPTGEIPRNFSVCIDRYLVNQLVPGQQVIITGVYSVQLRGGNQQGRNAQQAQLKVPYIHVLGSQLANRRYGDSQGTYSVPESEVQFFQQFARSPLIYKAIANSIAPAIFGHEDVKLALACLLFGGSTKVLPDGMRLRGDINVLLIGDPSTAKSQLLKFIQRVSDVGVYTSGKGSSAAGLTASITRSGNNGQFTLEAGALVIASGGVCCIDEFDKMRPEDRVVMHEAMEQQTISVAKAGITTRLNARCSVLAAANPIFGRYEDSKSITDQIELQTTILSRFDAIFIVRDQRTPEFDKRMADHILQIHTNSKMDEEREGALDMNMLRAYVKYAKSLPAPRMTAAAAQSVENLYVQDRQKSEQQGHHRTHGGKSHIPITVRQLEAIIRLSESLARITLKSDVDESHVEEAHRIFLNSTMQAVSMGAKEFGLDLPAELRSLSTSIEESIKRRLPIGSKVSYQKLKDELIGRFNNTRAVEFTIQFLIRQDDLQQVEQRKVLYRKK